TSQWAPNRPSGPGLSCTRFPALATAAGSDGSGGRASPSRGGGAAARTQGLDGVKPARRGSLPEAKAGRAPAGRTRGLFFPGGATSNESPNSLRQRLGSVTARTPGGRGPSGQPGGRRRAGGGGGRLRTLQAAQEHAGFGR